MKTIRTTSGAVYELDGDFCGAPGEFRVRRVNPSHEKRGDGEWQNVVAPPLIQEGRSMVLAMESLARYGGDDIGTRLDDVSQVTTRVTTPVVSIEES